LPGGCARMPVKDRILAQKPHLPNRVGRLKRRARGIQQLGHILAVSLSHRRFEVNKKSEFKGH